MTVLHFVRKYLLPLLLPITGLYAVVVVIRNLLYNKNILKSKSHKVFTICVGNLSAGGTGKTPHVEYLIKKLSLQYKTAILSRGYGRKTKGFLLAEPAHTALSIGDEPTQYKRKFKSCTIAVCGDRNLGVEGILKQAQETEIILLDDAFQHRAIKPSTQILITEYNRPFYKDCILPFGNLREMKKGYKRANILVVSKCPPTLSKEEKTRMRKKLAPLKSQRIFFSSIRYANPVRISNQGESQYKNILLFTGIANPEPLCQYLAEKFTIQLLAFPDHHPYTEKDIRRILSAYSTLEGEERAIFTTEKDYARLLHTPELDLLTTAAPIFYLPIEIYFHESDIVIEEILLQQINSDLASAIHSQNGVGEGN